MKALKMILLALCLVPIGQALGQETKAPDDDGPNEPSEKFGSPVKGPKCGELQGIGIGMVDECLGKPVPQRKSCVDNNKRKFIGLLMNKYGRKCAFVGNIVGRYAKQKGLEVREESGPRVVKKGPNRGVCRRWKATARRVLNNCKSKRGPKRRYCAIRAVRMYSAAVERNRFIRKVCPNLGSQIKGLAMTALGPKLTNSMERRYNKRRSNNKRFCRPLYSKYRKGINKCTRVRNKFRCLTNIKKRFDRDIRKPRLRVCRHVGNSLAQYAYSKRSLRRAMSRMRGEKIRHYSNRRPVRRGNPRVCRNIEIKARKALLFCSKKPPRNKMACVTKAKRKFDQQVRKARGCRGLDRKLGNYARSLKLPDPGKRRPSSVKRRNNRNRGIAKACRNLERSTKRSINRCARVRNVRNKMNCARKTKAKFDRQLRQRKFRKCRGLNRKIERHATRKGFGKRNMMRMSKVVKGRPGGPRKPASVAKRRRQINKCKGFMRWFNGVHRFCMKKKNPAKIKRCAMRSQRKIMQRKRKARFNPATCPRRHGNFDRKMSMMRRGRK